MPKVLISDRMSPLAAQILRERGIEVDERTDLTKEELADVIGAYDGLIVRSATKVTPKVLARAERLKVIGRAGIGVDNIDVAEATARGIVVMNTPFGNAITTAEHAIALMLSLARQIPQANASTHAGKWEKSRFLGVEVTGKTLGIIGCGNIGSIGVTKVDLDTLLARADFVSLHTPLTDQTRNIIDAEAIAKMKEGAFLINCARGGLVDEAALKEALDSGHLAGAALDVYVEEPARAHPLFGHPRLVATPHLGASTREAQTNVAIQIAEQVADFLLLGGVTNALNMPSMTPEEAPKLRPYMALARQLGSFMGQLVRSGLREVRVEYEGHVAELNTRPLTAVVLEGLLKPVMESVNMVNAPVIARERDIAVSEVIHERAGDYHTLMRLVVRTENRTRSVAGTLFSDQSPRVVQLDDVTLEAELAPDMLFVVNEDKPGFIGALGTLLGGHGVNIATFNLGRAAKGGLAVALLGVDQPIAGAVLEEVRALPYVRQAAPLRFS